MSTDARGHTSIAAGENPTRAALAAMLLSVKDPIPVANATARAAKIVELAALTPAITPSLSNPIFFFRADAPAGQQLEQTIDGTAFTSVNEPLSATTGKTGNPPAGSRIYEQVGYQAVTTGGSGLLPAVTFPVAFPGGCIGVWMQAINGMASNPVVNSGSLTASGFTGIVVGGTSGTAVQYCWLAKGW
jgi:hypothetical protein